LLLEPEKMIRREQPAERYQVLCEAENKQRKENGGIGPQPPAGGAKKPKKLMSWQEIQLKVESVIANREQNEAEAHTEERPLGSNVAENDPAALVHIDTLEETLRALEETLRAPGAVEPKRRAKAKAASGKRHAKAKAAPTHTIPPPPTPLETESHGASPSEAAEDELAAQICSKIGGDGRAVRNLDIQKILQGEQIGRTLQGASWFQLGLRLVSVEGG